MGVRDGWSIADKKSLLSKEIKDPYMNFPCLATLNASSLEFTLSLK